jgi:hypothetical protein
MPTRTSSASLAALPAAVRRQIEQNPTGRIDDAVWSGLNEEQKSAVRSFRDEFSGQRSNGQQRRLDGQSRTQAPNPGRDVFGSNMPTVAEVMAQARAAPGNPGVTEPWGGLPPNRMMAMAINVENLFSEHDAPGKADEEFTPEAGYTRDTVLQHLDNIAAVIKSVNGGQGPHILATMEVEQRSLLEKLVDLKLGGLGYQTIALEEGRDPRGIDVGLISKYPLWGGSRPSLIFAGDGQGQRGILRAELNVEGKRTVVYVNHWKSMRDGEDVAAQENSQIAAALKADIAATMAADPNTTIMAMGDFNTKMSEGNQRAMESLGTKRSGDGLENSQMWDATHTFGARRSEGIDHVLVPDGTHSYQGHADFLDRFMVNGAAATGASGITFDPKSLVVLPTPGRFFGRDQQVNPNGVSDHKPMVAQFEIG